MLELGILLALICAFVSNLGFFYKHRGACQCTSVDVKHPVRSAKALFSSKWFAIGMAVATSAWVFHVAALAVAPLSVVQAVLAGGVVLLAVMADKLFGFEVGRRQWWGLGLTAVGLILLVVTLPAQTGSHSSFHVGGMIAFETGLFAVGGLLILGRRAPGTQHHHGIMLGAAAGILFGVSDIAIKALTGLAGGGVLGVLLSPWFGVAVIASIAAFYSSAKGLQDGDAVPVIAITGTAANIAAISGGIVVFGDPMPSTALGVIVQASAFVLVIIASALTPAPVRAAEGDGAIAVPGMAPGAPAAGAV